MRDADHATIGYTIAQIAQDMCQTTVEVNEIGFV